MPLPSKIVLSMGQHIGAPAAPQVAKGDQVHVGTVVGKAGGFVSMDIHSGVSGTVDGIITITAPNGAPRRRTRRSPPPLSPISSPSRMPSGPAAWWVWAARASPRR